MAKLPQPIADFLSGHHFAVAGVSRDSMQPANSIFRRLQESGCEVFPVNPNASQVEGVTSYPEIAALPQPVDGVVIVTHPKDSVEIVRQCSANGVSQVWFHRSLGDGSVSQEAVRECETLGIEAIVGGCPMMFCEPVDFGHKCMRWWFQRTGKVPR